MKRPTTTGKEVIRRIPRRSTGLLLAQIKSTVHPHIKAAPIPIAYRYSRPPPVIKDTMKWPNSAWIYAKVEN